MALIDKEIVKIALTKGFTSIFTEDNDYYFWLCDLQKWLREEHFTQSIFVSVEVFTYESPGNYYFIPKIDFQRGHKEFRYGAYSKEFSEIWQIKVCEGKIKFTFHPDSYKEALEAGLLQALLLIK